MKIINIKKENVEKLLEIALKERKNLENCGKTLNFHLRFGITHQINIYRESLAVENVNWNWMIEDNSATDILEKDLKSYILDLFKEKEFITIPYQPTLFGPCTRNWEELLTIGMEDNIYRPLPIGTLVKQQKF